MSPRHLLAVAALLGASPALAQPGESAEAMADSPWEARLGLSAHPLLSGSALSYFKTGTIRDGGWISVDAAPAYRFSRLFSAELGLSALVPIQNAWGFPDFRLALTPAARLDVGPVYARVEVPLMFGEGFRSAYRGTVGATVLGRLYAGLFFEYIPKDLLGGLGLELGLRFGNPRPAR